MKKVVLLSMVALFLMGAVAFAANPPVLRWDASSTAWTTVATAAIASATADNTWTSASNDGILDPSYTVGGVAFSILPGTPTWTKLPRITWNVKISQWIYISIQYLVYNVHVDLPGKYMLDDLTIHVESNGNTYVYFGTGGDLEDNNSNTMDTYFAAFTSGALYPGAPWTSDWTSINDLPDQANYMKVNTIGGSQTFTVWFGFDVGKYQPKGKYSTYVDIYIQSDP